MPTPSFFIHSAADSVHSILEKYCFFESFILRPHSMQSKHIPDESLGSESAADYLSGGGTSHQSACDIWRFIPAWMSQSCVSALPSSISSELYMNSVHLTLHPADHPHMHTSVVQKKNKLTMTTLCSKLGLGLKDFCCFSLFCGVLRPRGDKCLIFQLMSQPLDGLL